ncbi:4-hydroxy-tetrahydrodipicolinate synthase [Tannockella kyphosi]|uniref:4-hydroxy-tetrahydrodipicolinate synthase n=1 Tax=Tannockella kyphosi TaxID=2899121 RepID=UPI002013A023|nr:4-hydroxy-tetrahydrodipicolinate synthase [Tannockella kyphosi]
MALFEGCGTALVTPMNEDFSVDYGAYEKLVRSNLEGGVKAIIVNGTTGEPATLVVEEEHELLKLALKVAKGKCKVIAGTGSNDTKHAIDQSKYVESLGVDGLLVVTPYYNKTSKEGLLKHYLMIADSVNIPIILYCVPSRTGMLIEVDTVVELAKHKNIVGIKDATGNLSYALEIMTKTRDIEDFVVYSGNDDIILPMMASGAKGVISVVSNVYPRETQMLCQHILDGNMEEAKKMALDMDDLNDQLFSDVNPINAKAALSKKGICKNILRMPLVPTTQAKREALFAAMDAFDALGY